MMTPPRKLNGLAASVAVTLLAALSAAGRATEVPPLSDPPSGIYQPGKLVWIDLITADLPGARRFYGALFGWTFAEPGQDHGEDHGQAPGAYTLAYEGGVPVAGLAQRTPAPQQQRKARWIAFMSVADVKAAAEAVAGKGGKVLISPRQVPARGEVAVVADPDGAPFGLIRSSSGDPADGLPPAGDWIWAIYQSPDATSAAAFYQDLGGYDVVRDERPVPALGNAPHFILVAGGYARASLVEIPAEQSGLRPEWLYFVRVNRVGDSLARVRELGGTVLMEPRPEILDGRLAIIADPAGAPLGLMEWDEAAGEEQ